MTVRRTSETSVQSYSRAIEQPAGNLFTPVSVSYNFSSVLNSNMKLMLTNVSCPVEPAGLRTDLTGNCVLTESDCERKNEEKHVEEKEEEESRSAERL